MLKRIWAYYENLDYRVLAEKLDEMARAGWRLKHLGLLGPIFEDCAPNKTVYHRVIRSPQISGEPIPAGWTFLLRSGQRTVITRMRRSPQRKSWWRIGKMTIIIAGRNISFFAGFLW